jgi:hypothetical protein
MQLRGKKVFTGRMQLFEGWEIRPFAIKREDGTYAPRLSARKHSVGSETEKVFAFDLKCLDKEEAFELALARGRSLVFGT